jgi:hypothetical protein
MSMLSPAHPRAAARGRAACALLCAASIAVLAGCGSDTATPPAAASAPRPAASARAASAAPVYPLKASPTRRYLVDQRNRPFMIVGDSPQSMIVNLSRRRAASFLANRERAGFNAVWVNLLCVEYTGGRADGSTYDGILPFRRRNDLSTPNPAYFARADAMIRTAAKHGITVFLDPIETGGWLGVLRDSGPEKAAAYGRYLGHRYRNFPNIVWMSGNDFSSAGDATNDAVVLAVANGIKSTDPNHIHTVELGPPQLPSSLDDPAWRPVISLDAAYPYTLGPTYAPVLSEYARPDFMPVFMVEANYDGENDYDGPQTLRRQEYWSLLSGATGQFYGNAFTWPFKAGWRKHLDTPGSRQMRYVVRLFDGRPWWLLVPDPGHQVLVSGFGTFATTGSVNHNDYATAASTPDGRLFMAYLPTRRTVAVDLTKLSGPVRARWYDPSAGRYRAAAQAALPNTGVRTFTPPGANAEGDGDWVLVLTAG